MKRLSVTKMNQIFKTRDYTRAARVRWPASRVLGRKNPFYWHIIDFFAWTVAP